MTLKFNLFSYGNMMKKMTENTDKCKDLGSCGWIEILQCEGRTILRPLGIAVGRGEMKNKSKTNDFNV